MKILIIDDESLVRKSIRRALEMRGHQVTEAVDGKSGLQTWKEVDPDLVLLDVLMPELSGFEVIQQRPDQNRSKVIMISAFTGADSSEDPKHYGADLFIAKPFQDIFAVVEQIEVLGGRS